MMSCIETVRSKAGLTIKEQRMTTFVFREKNFTYTENVIVTISPPNHKC